MTGVRLLLSKELRLLLREGTVILAIILPFVMYSAMGGMFAKLSSEVSRAYRLKGYSIAVVPGAPSEEQAARMIVALLRAQHANVRLAKGSPKALLERYTLVILVPRGFTRNLTRGLNATLIVYLRASLSKLAAATAAPSGVVGVLARGIGGGSRLRVEAYIYINGRVMSVEKLSRIVSAGMGLVDASIFVIFPVSSFAALLIGSEKEERMLDVLLSLPLPRRDIALSKMLSAIIVGAMAAASSIAGFYVMLAGATGGRSASLFYSMYTAEQMVEYFIAILASALFASALSLLLSLFTESVRGAQSITLIATLPALAAVFTVFTGIPVNPALYAVPYMCVVYASFSPLTGQTPAIASITAQLVETGIVVYVFVKLLSSEAAVTASATLRRLLRGRRRAAEEALPG